MSPESPERTELTQEELNTGSSFFSSFKELFPGTLITIVLTIAAALLLRLFILEAFRIPSTSMEPTLRSGDYVLVNKFIYGIRTPSSIPFTRYFFRAGVWLPVFTPSRGDVMVFQFPPDALRETLGAQSYYIKRCVGLPGDTVRLEYRNVFVNSEPFSRPWMPERFQPRHESPSDFFPDGYGFSHEHYGPLLVPRRGTTLDLDPKTSGYWRDILLHEGNDVEITGAGVVHVNGVERSEYVVQKDYYFVLGDNAQNSLDSRFWGFVPEDLLVGRALMVYWSSEPASGAPQLNRIGTIIE